MDLKNWRIRLALAAMLFAGALACRTTDTFIAQATATRTRTPRPTLTPIPSATVTLVPTMTATSAPTASPTKKPTPKPPTPKPPTAVPKPVVQQSPVSTMEFHVDPATCAHSGQSYIKGTVYLDRNDKSQRYVGAIVALGAPDGNTIYDIVKTDDNGEYTFILADQGQAKPGYWGLWLITPSHVRKSDIGGPINTNDLPAENPNSCWAGTVDFWK